MSNYELQIILRDTLRLFQESKLLWIFGIIAFVSEVIFRGSIYSIRNPPVPCIAYPLFFISLYFSFVAKCSLIYTANQILSEQKATYSEVWIFCKTKLRRIAGLYFLSIPLVMFSVFIVAIAALSEITPSLTWVVELLVTFFSICTIVIHHLEAGLALWTGLLIVVNNVFHVVILNSIFLILQIALNLSIRNGLFGIFFIVPVTVTMTLAYRVFIAKGS